MSRLLPRLATIALLGALAWLVYSWAQREDLVEAPRPMTGLLFPGLDVQAVTYIHLTLDFGHDLELQREPGGSWRITAPTEEVARAELVGQWLDNVSRATVEPLELHGEPVPASELGLDPPRHQFTIGDESGETMTIFVGAVEPLGRYVYARAQGSEAIGLVTRNIVSLTSYHGEEWVDPSLLRGLQGRITSVRVVRPDGVLLEAERQGDAWVLAAPKGVLSDSTRISKLVRSLQFARQEVVLAGRPTIEDLRRIGFPSREDREAGEPGAATLIEIGATGEGTVHAFLAPGWEMQGDIIAAMRGDGVKVVGVPADALNLLRNEPDWFRDHALLPPVRERARSLRIERDDEVLVDVRMSDKGQWEFHGPARLVGESLENERLLGRTALTDLLGLIDGHPVEAFVDAPAGEPWGRIVVGWDWAGEVRLDRVDVFAPDAGADGPMLARTSLRPNEGLQVAASLRALFDPIRADLLRSLSPLELDVEAWHGFLIHHPELPEPLEILRGADDTWTGDDAWGRRYGLAHDLLRGFRGYHWQPSRSSVAYRAEVVFHDDQGGVLARLSFRPTLPDEEPEAAGHPVVIAAIDRVPGFELVLPRVWLDRIDALEGPQERR